MRSRFIALTLTAALFAPAPGCATRLPVGRVATPAPVLGGPAPAPEVVGRIPPTVQDLDLTGLILAAARENPRLSAARNQWLAARARPTIARSLPDPMLTYVEMLEPIQTRVGPLERSFQLMQAIPFPGKLMAAGSVADEHACIKELEYHIALRDVVADVKIAYAELGYLQQAVAIVHENRQVATLLANKAAAAYGGQGDVTPDGVTLFDTLKAQASLAQLAYDEMTLSEMVRTEEATINALLSRPTALPVGAPLPIRFRPLDVHREVLFQVAAARRQEIQAALHKVQAAHHAERLARLSQVPDINLGLQYSVLGEAINPIPGSGDDALGVSLGISLPLWGPKNQARIAEAQALAWAARDEQRAVTDDVMARITKVFFQLQNAERLSHLYRDSLLPQAEDAVRLAEEWHGAGRDTYGRLLEARTVWFNFQLAAARAVADHEQMVARLEQLVGISLEHFRSEGSAR